MRHTDLTGESAEYVAAREDLRLAEIELMRQRERVARQRRDLPPGPVVPNYVLRDGNGPVTLDELVTDRPLIVYHLMYGKRQTTPCPMCTMWIDGFNGVAQHIARNVDLAIVAAAEPDDLDRYGRERGWDQLRLLSAGDSTFKRDLRSEDEDGNQDSTVSVFVRDDDGVVRHHYTAHPRMAEDIQERGIDLLAPVWHLLDLTPAGRGDWYAGLDYGRLVSGSRT
ncbi:DUF899 family protein [Kutzneria buriramensis]|uniref:Putative dithiol-disulfide oxidoreductase (DUF899 family) n=1 Tax=Kutzneria buriramensis TaxID=1045776 RepID=A0A3E0IB53_9PSEU|nr:DUF899 family protein [Kutzneria buriramensis]REH55385.1 putative dithiol-disulfide oxidoreductase (DUF899 family) [Kutzneria buriramensis]